MPNWDFVAQAGVLVFGLSAMFLVARKNKWGFVLGLLAQPCWLYTSYVHGQLGIMFNTFIYTGIWAYGLYNWFWGNARDGQGAKNPVQSENTVG